MVSNSVWILVGLCVCACVRVSSAHIRKSQYRLNKASKCDGAMLTRLDELERKLDILLDKLSEQDKDPTESPMGAQPPTMAPVPTHPTAFPDDSIPPAVSSNSAGTVEMVVTVGYEARLPCIAEKFNDQVVWYLYSNLLATGFYAYSADLRIGVQRSHWNLWYLNIASVSEKDQGVYTCVAGAKASKIFLKVVEPAFTTTNAKIGSPLYLPCSVLAPTNNTDENEQAEEISVVWTDPNGAAINEWESHHFPSTDRISVNPKTHVLVFTQLTIGDAGNYTCAVDGNFRSRAINQVLIQDDPPTFVPTSTPDVVEAAQGDDVTLSCSARGIPCPVIQWKVNNTLLSETSYCDNDVTTSTVSLKEVTSPSTIITFVAKNPYGEMERTMHVNARGRNPVFTSTPKKVISMVGGAAIFHCAASASTSTVITWNKYKPGSRSGQAVQSSKRYQIVSSIGESYLVIERVNGKMGGTKFECVARNAEGSVNASANLEVALHEVVMYGNVPELKLSRQPNATALFRCSSDEAKPCAPFSYHWFSHNSLLDVRDPRFTVTDGECYSELSLTDMRNSDPVQLRIRCSVETEHIAIYSKEKKIDVRAAGYIELLTRHYIDP